MQLLSLLFFYFFVLLIGILPFRLVYLLSDLTSWGLRIIVKYRRAVISDNLSKAIPDIRLNENNERIKGIYRNITDNLLESIKSFTMLQRDIVKRYKIENPELLMPYFKKGQSIIGVTMHYANWEWGSLAASLQTPYKYVAFYKPLHNKHIDRLLKKSRSKCGTELASIYHTSATFSKYKEESVVYLMAADQSPSKRQLKHAFWFNFFGLKTPFLHGFEKHARQNDYPIIFIDIKRKRRGYYSVVLSVLENQPNLVAEGEITRKYVQKIESIIKEKPEHWLWSHKRWKHLKK